MNPSFFCSLHSPPPEWKKFLKIHPKVLNFFKTYQKEISSYFKHEIDYSWSVILCGEKKITNLNLKYRQKNKKTDVLSFAYHSPKELKSFKIPEVYLGEIYICHPVMLKQAKIHSLSPFEELWHLYFHGLLHLFGFDHEFSKIEKDKMEKEEERLWKFLQKALNYDEIILRSFKIN